MDNSREILLLWKAQGQAKALTPKGNERKAFEGNEEAS